MNTSNERLDELERWQVSISDWIRGSPLASPSSSGEPALTEERVREIVTLEAYRIVRQEFSDHDVKSSLTDLFTRVHSLESSSKHLPNYEGSLRDIRSALGLSEHDDHEHVIETIRGMRAARPAPRSEENPLLAVVGEGELLTARMLEIAREEADRACIQYLQAHLDASHRPILEKIARLEVSKLAEKGGAEEVDETMTEKNGDAFRRHIEAASEIVSKWPSWMRHTAEQMFQVPHVYTTAPLSPSAHEPSTAKRSGLFRPPPWTALTKEYLVDPRDGQPWTQERVDSFCTDPLDEVPQPIERDTYDPPTTASASPCTHGMPNGGAWCPDCCHNVAASPPAPGAQERQELGGTPTERAWNAYQSPGPIVSNIASEIEAAVSAARREEREKTLREIDEWLAKSGFSPRGQFSTHIRSLQASSLPGTEKT